MRSSRFVVALAATLLGALAAVPPTLASESGPVNFAAAKTQSVKDARPVLVKFSTEW